VIAAYLRRPDLRQRLADSWASGKGAAAPRQVAPGA